MDVKQRMLKVLNETLEYYEGNPELRAVNVAEGCDYFLNGKMCAVGRCLVDAESFQSYINDINCNSTVKDLYYHFKEENSELPFKEEYKGLTIRFWSMLQRLHDKEKYWNGDKLSEVERKSFVDIIKTNIDNGLYLNEEGI